ncbi:DUF3885 domain-containing protein [Streptosporangium roseum]|uniref:DUF3885 domain-containing protein n=1 Tax=Streptosporangium roseum TaxID=2001 RepID=UPI003AFB33A5
MASPTTSPVAGSCDGGADVILSARAERDGLKARHHTWLSDHPAVLFHGALPSEYGIGPPVRRRPLPRTFGAVSPGAASGPGPIPLTLLRPSAHGPVEGLRQGRPTTTRGSAG